MVSPLEAVSISYDATTGKAVRPAMGCVLDRNSGGCLKVITCVTFDFLVNSNANLVEIAEHHVLMRCYEGETISTGFWGVTGIGFCRQRQRQPCMFYHGACRATGSGKVLF